MPLRGKPPEAVEKRLKMLVYGPAGTGKTTAAIQFPKPYLIDTEKGAEHSQYVDLLSGAGGAVFQSSEFDEMMDEVTALLTEEHEFRTLIIDPITVVWDQLVAQSEDEVGSEFGRHFGLAGKKMKRLFNMLVRLDMNVIVTSHAKPVYGDAMKIEGHTFDGWKKLDYLFDLVIELQKRGKDRRVGVVRKTRMEAFPTDDSFDFGYPAICERWDAESLERQAEVQELATPDEVAQVTKLVATLNVDSKTVSGWFRKAEASSFEDMPRGAVVKCIEHLRAKLEKEVTV